MTKPVSTTPRRSSIRRAEIYRKAAKLIEDEEADYSCEAIGQVACRAGWAALCKENPDWPEMLMMEPESTASCGGWWHNKHERDARVFGLCLAAAIAERP